MVQRAFLIISEYIMRKLSGLYNLDKGYIGKKRRAVEKGAWLGKVILLFYIPLKKIPDPTRRIIKSNLSSSSFHIILRLILIHFLSVFLPINQSIHGSASA